MLHFLLPASYSPVDNNVPQSGCLRLSLWCSFFSCMQRKRKECINSVVHMLLYAVVIIFAVVEEQSFNIWHLNDSLSSTGFAFWKCHVIQCTKFIYTCKLFLHFSSSNLLPNYNQFVVKVHSCMTATTNIQQLIVTLWKNKWINMEKRKIRGMITPNKFKLYFVGHACIGCSMKYNNIVFIVLQQTLYSSTSKNLQV